MHKTTNKIMMILMIAIGISSVAFGQTKMSKNADNSVQAQIIALEKAGWEAWKNKDSSWFQNNLSEDALHVDSAGVTDKAQSVKAIADCEVKNVSLDNFKFLMLDKNSRRRVLVRRHIRDAFSNCTIFRPRHRNFIDCFIIHTAPPRAGCAAPVSRLGLSVRAVFDAGLCGSIIFRLHRQQSVSEPIRTGSTRRKLPDI